MLIVIPDLLDRDAALALRAQILSADWIDGNATSGPGSALKKKNRQLPEECDEARAAQAVVAQALGTNDLFLSAALPHTIFPPLFNRYGPGETFGTHVDNAVRVHGGSGIRIRTDLSATLFLTDPDDYDGGELEIEGPFGSTSYKLPPGHMILYPSSSLHRVTPVTRGERVSSFFWMQSLVASAEARSMLFELDQSIQALTVRHGSTDTEVLRLTNVYHNMMRRWATA
ncbi:MAG: Fe2+-dependent dioxygenase [Sphingobium sp.]